LTQRQIVALHSANLGATGQERPDAEHRDHRDRDDGRDAIRPDASTHRRAAQGISRRLLHRAF
jgi:hypothetical protein